VTRAQALESVFENVRQLVGSGDDYSSEYQDEQHSFPMEILETQV